MPRHLSGWTVHVARPSVHRPATEMLTVARHDVQLTPDQAERRAAEAREVDGGARRREKEFTLSRFWSLAFTYAAVGPTGYGYESFHGLPRAPLDAYTQAAPPLEGSITGWMVKCSHATIHTRPGSKPAIVWLRSIGCEYVGGPRSAECRGISILRGWPRHRRYERTMHIP